MLKNLLGFNAGRVCGLDRVIVKSATSPPFPPPDCPLDPLYEQRGRRDEENQCQVRKSTRLRIVAEAATEGVEMKLPYGGLTHEEHTNEQRSTKAKAHWQALSPEEKRKQLSNLQPYGANK